MGNHSRWDKPKTGRKSKRGTINPDFLVGWEGGLLNSLLARGSKET